MQHNHKKWEIVCLIAQIYFGKLLSGGLSGYSGAGLCGTSRLFGRLVVTQTRLRGRAVKMGSILDQAQVCRAFCWVVV